MKRTQVCILHITARQGFVSRKFKFRTCKDGNLENLSYTAKKQKLKMHQRLRIPLIIAITVLIIVPSNQIEECDLNYTTVVTRKARGRLGNHIWSLMGK